MKPAIIDITGIGPAAAAALAEHGFGSVKALARASVAQVSTVPGFSSARAEKVIAAAAQLQAAPAADTPAAADTPKEDRKDKKKKDKKKKDKKKKDKKGKGKNKNKK
ncbi:MAG: helix-hairpin-helix domain-containing protein [Gammaproteobacteria bacterium]|jgi:NAD-dependent DNA ligase